MNETPFAAALPDNAELSGWLLIDKPAGMSSHDVLARLRRVHRKIKMGHAGTLDPLATGLLLVAIGSTTRLVEASHALEKSYDARIRLGAVSSTDDADGEIAELPDATPPDLVRIESALAAMTGTAVLQIPPSVSAIHVDGKRAYDMVRKGVEVRLEARPVRIDRIVVREYAWPWLDISVDCGAGTYIRSIARDLGTALGCGGLIETLRRTRIGPFDVADSISLSQAEAEAGLAGFVRAPATSLANWRKFPISVDQVARIARGQSIRLDAASIDDTRNSDVALIDPAGALIALATAVATGDSIVCKPYRVFVQQKT